MGKFAIYKKVGEEKKKKEKTETKRKAQSCGHFATPSRISAHLLNQQTINYE